MIGRAGRLVRIFALAGFGLLLAPPVLATPISAQDALTIFNPDGSVFRRTSLTADQTHGGATAVLADSLETVPDAFGSPLPLLDTMAGVAVLTGPGVPFAGTAATRLFGIFSLSGSVPGVVFLNFVTGDAITRVGSPSEFALVSGAPITITHPNHMRVYDATPFLFPDARTAGYTATFQNGISDTGPTWLLLGLAIFATAWFGRRMKSEWS